MKTIILIRHGKAEERTPEIEDLTRGLVKRGEKDSQQMAERLKKRGIEADLLISSTAKRAIETANIFARELDYPLNKIRRHPTFYESESEQFLPILKKLDNKVGTVLLFGHEPTLSSFAASLVSGLSGSFPKSGLVGIGFDVTYWGQVEANRGSLKIIEYPHGAKKSDRLLAQFVRRELEQKVKDYFASKDEKVAEALSRDIRKSAVRLGERFQQEYGKRPK